MFTRLSARQEVLLRSESMALPRVRLRFAPEYISYPLAVFLVMLVVSSFTGHWVTDENPYRSYTLQACAWLEGRLDLGQDYPWLELAIVDGKYYVSFPPFPSFVLLPFAAMYGVNTPDHMISMVFTMLGVLYALRLYEQMTGSLKLAERYVLFLFLGNGYLFISIQGWVWYLAQCMCFTLSLAALCYAVEGKGGRAFTLWACAVGCRPMVAIYFPLLVYLVYAKWKNENTSMIFPKLIKKKWYWAIPVIVIASVYMALNYARFGNPFEFGHNHLPEFIRAEEGQFSLSYAMKHFAELIRLPQTGGENGALKYYTFDCMAFWLIAPMTISFAAAWLYSMVCKRKAKRFVKISLPLMLFAHLMIVCCHRTMGGYQFGNRYIVDMLPYVFFGLLAFKPENEKSSNLNIPLFMLGLSVNLIGTVATYNHWI